MRRSGLDGWSSTERHASSGAVWFEERARPHHPVVELTEEGALALARQYWQEVESFTLRLVRARERGGQRELRLLGRWTLLRFGAPEVTVGESGTRSRFPIVGGQLARTPGGSITFAQVVWPAVELRVTVEGFVPRFDDGAGSRSLAGALSRYGQRRLHVGVSRSYFTRLIREAAR